MGINTGFIKVRIRPDHPNTLAAHATYDVALSDGITVHVRLDKPQWIPPASETEAQFSFPLGTKGSNGLREGEKFTLLQNGEKMGAGVILDTASIGISEST